MNRIARSLAVATVAGAALMASACSGDADNVNAVADQLEAPQAEWYRTAQDEPPMRFYSMHDTARINAVAEAFQEKYPGLEVESLRLATGQLLTRYTSEQEGDARTADVITIGDLGFVRDAAEKGWVADLDVNEIPALAAIDDTWIHPAAVTAGINPLGIAYNTDSVQTPPSDWSDLLDEEWAGELVMPDFRNAPVYMDQARLWLDEYGLEYLRELDATGPFTVDSALPGAQSVAAGQYDVLAPAVPLNVQQLQADGAPIDIIIPDDVIGTQLYTAISADSPSISTSKLFLDFLMTEEGQMAYIGDSAVSPVNSEGSMPLPAGYRDTAPEQMEKTRKILEDEGLFNH